MGCRRTELAGSRAASGDREPHTHTPGTSPAAGAAAIPQPRVLWVAAPSLEHPPKPRARPVPRERYQEPACLVANRAGAGARSCVCACGCSGNSRPARNRAPGASQAARQQQAGRRMDRWTDRWTDGRTDGLSPNTTRAEASVRRGLYCRAGSQRGAAAPLGSGFLKAVGAHLGENSGDFGTFGGGRGTRSGARATSPGPAPSQEQPSGSGPWVPPWG